MSLAPGGGVPPSPPAQGWCRELLSFPLRQPEPCPHLWEDPTARGPGWWGRETGPAQRPSSHPGKVQTRYRKKAHCFPNVETKSFTFLL